MYGELIKDPIVGLSLNLKQVNQRHNCLKIEHSTIIPFHVSLLKNIKKLLNKNIIDMLN